MFRTVIFCLPLLLAAVTAPADDAVEGASLAHREEVQQAQPAAEAKVKQEKPKPDGEAKQEAKADGDVEMSGMSILGNDEAPKSLVIVPWKSSQLGEMPGLSKLLDDSTQPVDKDVFMRELAYYQIRANSK